MKKNLVVFLVLSILLSGLIGCSAGAKAEAENLSTFVTVESNFRYKIVYHSETKVMYVMSCGHYKDEGIFTALLNADGSPMLYE